MPRLSSGMGAFGGGSRHGGVTVELRATRDLEVLARNLKAAGRGDLRKKMLAGIRTEVKPVIPDIRANALATLPSRGGLAADVASSKYGVRTRTSGHSVGVRVQATHPRDIRALNDGRLRHPLFGDRSHWYQQSVKPGWFYSPLQAAKPELQRRVIAVLDEVSRDIRRGL